MYDLPEITKWHKDAPVKLEKRADFKKRLNVKDEKLWHQFVHWRTMLRRHGLSAKESDYLCRTHAKFCLPGHEDPKSTRMLEDIFGQTEEVPAIREIVEKEQTATTGATNSKDFNKAMDATGGKLPSIKESLLWIYNHVADKEVTIFDAPSPGAFAHLKEIQRVASTRSDFYRNVIPRFLPARVDADDDGGFSKDNRVIEGRIDALERELTGE
jgi:hypothetical protein